MIPRAPRPPVVVTGLGEALYDLLPAGPTLGGAPVNFAVHARQLLDRHGAAGSRVAVATRAGNDDLGRRLLDDLVERGLEISAVQVDAERPTGTAAVGLGDGDPLFTIAADAAWDRCEADGPWRTLAAETQVVCFGTLGSRSPASAVAIEAFLACSEPAVRLFDVNLRDPFHSPELIRRLCRLATMLKVNGRELQIVADALGVPEAPAIERLARLRQAAGLEVVILTRGTAGATIVTSAGECSAPARPLCDASGSQDLVFSPIGGLVMTIAGATRGVLDARRTASIFLLGTLLAATSLSSTSRAALIAQDQFLTGASPAAGQYSTGFVNGQNPTVTGFTNAWEVGGQQGATVLGSGLSYSNGSGTVASAGGSLQSRNGFRVRHFLTTPYGASSSGTIYMSLMLDFAATSAAYNAFELYQGTLDADRALSVGLANGSSTTNFVALIKGVASPLLLGAASTDTQFFVMKFDFSTSPNADSFTIWRNPSDLASEAGSGAGQTVTGLNFVFNNLAVADYVSPVSGATADEFRIAPTWNEATTVAAVPEPAALSLPGLVLGGIVVAWRRRRRPS